MTQAGDQPRDDIALAGEYALHLLDADSRFAFEQRLRDEPELRNLLREWDEGLVSLATEMNEVEPPAAIKRAIEVRLFSSEKADRERWFGRIGRWIGAAALVAAAFALAMYVAPSFTRPDVGPNYLAEIAADDRSVVVEAVFDPDTGEIDLDTMVGAPAEGRVFELWLIADGAPAPVSLGVLPQTGTDGLTVPEVLRSAMLGGTLAISDEPPGGSPTGAPTGDIVAVGLLTSS